MVNDAIYHIPEANIDDIPEASGYQPQFQGIPVGAAVTKAVLTRIIPGSSTLIPPPMYSSGYGRHPYRTDPDRTRPHITVQDLDVPLMASTSPRTPHLGSYGLPEPRVDMPYSVHILNPC